MCPAECQKEDWGVHKSKCKILAEVVKHFPMNSKELVLDPDRGAKFWRFDDVLDYAADYMKKMRHARIWLPQVCLCLGLNV